MANLVLSAMALQASMHLPCVLHGLPVYGPAVQAVHVRMTQCVVMHNFGLSLQAREMVSIGCVCCAETAA